MGLLRDFLISCAILSLGFAPPPVRSLAESPAQDTRPSAPVDTRISTDGAKLAFSQDGRVLREVGSSIESLERLTHVRAIIYNARTGAVIHVTNLPADTEVQSLTVDGRAAIVAAGVTGERLHFFLLDTDTGILQDVPYNWYDPDDPDQDAALSGDGLLFSIYSESGSTDNPMAVSVYDWTTKKLVAKRTSQQLAAGGSFSGGVTVDGAVEFANDRYGRRVINLKTGRTIGRFAWNSVRSPDGAWVIEFPDQTAEELAPQNVLVKDGASGQTVGKLTLEGTDGETGGINGQMTGAFCGSTGRLIVGSGSSVAAYALPSGALLKRFPAAAWRGKNVDDIDRVPVACSPDGARVAILSGSRLTFHDLK